MIEAGHHVETRRSLVEREVVVPDRLGRLPPRAFTAALRARNIRFFTSAMSNDQVQDAIFDAEGIEEVWVAALTKDGEQRDGSSVCELTSLVELSSLPERNTAHRQERAAAPRCPAQPVPVPRVPLLGLLHRLRGRAR